jgi:hypothetical protein
MQANKIITERPCYTHARDNIISRIHSEESNSNFHYNQQIQLIHKWNRKKKLSYFTYLILRLQVSSLKAAIHVITRDSTWIGNHFTSWTISAALKCKGDFSCSQFATIVIQKHLSKTLLLRN